MWIARPVLATSSVTAPADFQHDADGLKAYPSVGSAPRWARAMPEGRRMSVTGSVRASSTGSARLRADLLTPLILARAEVIG